MVFQREILPLAVFKMSILLMTFFLSIRLGISLPQLDYENELARLRYAQYNCYLFKHCKKEHKVVCAYDHFYTVMNTFENNCEVLKVNCEQRKYFKIIEMYHCESKKYFLDFHNDSLQWQHVDRSYVLNFMTTEPTSTTPAWRIVPGLVKLVNKMFKYVLRI